MFVSDKVGRCFVKRLGPDFFPPIDFYMIMATLTDIIFWKICPKTAKTVPMAEKAITEYGGACKFDEDETKFGFTVGGDNKITLHVHYELYHMEVFFNGNN